MYSEIEQRTQDIDWFFTDNEFIAFVASGSGRLPDTLAKMEENEINLKDNYLDSLIETEDFIINPNLYEIAKLNNFEVNERYLSYFIKMARKGFYTFDKTLSNDFSDSRYHMVTSPTNPLIINKLPENIQSILRKTFFQKSLKNISCLNVNEIE